MASSVHTEVLCSFRGGPNDGVTVRMPVVGGRPPATAAVTGKDDQVIYHRRRVGKRWVYEQAATT